MRTAVIAVLALMAMSVSARQLAQMPAPSAPASPAATTSFATYPEALSAATALGSEAPISIFLAAVQAANLTLALDNGNPYTILAPTNASFAEALKALCLTQDALLADKPLLTKILSYHVISGGALLSTQLTDGQKVDTLLTDAATNQPIQLTVDLSSGVKFVSASNSASVVIPDIQAGNTVVHVIDMVLVPPGVTSACAGASG